MTTAVVCDGVIECQDGEDERQCKNESEYHTYLILSSATVLLIFFIIKLLKKLGKEIRQHCDSENIALKAQKSLEDVITTYEINHEDLEIIEEVNIFFVKNIFSKRTHERLQELKELSLTFYDFEARYHTNEENDLFSCLHSHLDPMVADLVISSKFPGITDTYFGWAKPSLEKLKRSNTYYTATKTVGLMTNFTDFFKDTYLLYTIILAVGGVKAVFVSPQLFTSVIVWSLFLSITIPLFLSTLDLAINNPTMIYMRTEKVVSRSLLSLMRLGVLVCSILNPIFLISLYESTQKSLRLKAERAVEDEKVAKLLKIARKIKKQYASFLRIDLGLEIYYQVAGQTLLLFLSDTLTPTTGGLKTLFESDDTYFGWSSQVWLSLSITWSLTACVRRHVKSVKVDKGYFPFKAHFFVILWAICATGRRIFSIVAFFTPALGLFNILYHSLAEQIPFSIRKELAMKGNITPLDTLDLFNTSRTIYWSEIDRWDYSNPYNPSPPHYSKYTGLSLKHTFIAFLIIFVLHFLLVFLVKMFTLQEKVNNFNVVVHVLENMNLAFPLADWDSCKDDTVAGHKEKFASVKMEMLLAMVVNMLVSVSMLMPLWYTGWSK